MTSGMAAGGGAAAGSGAPVTSGAATGGGATPSQTVGPFFRFGLEWLHSPDLVAPGSAGAVTIAGQITDGAAQPVPDAVVELWHPGPPADGDAPGPGRFGRCLVDGDGCFHFTIPRPESPGPGQAPHVTLTVFARGLLNRLVTRCYLPEDRDAHAADPALAAVPAERRPTLVAVAQDGAYRFDVRLQGDDETVFFAW